MQHHFPKGVSELPDVEFDVAVTMGCENERLVLKTKHREDWNILCPKAMDSEQFRKVRDDIREMVKELLKRFLKPEWEEPLAHTRAGGAGGPSLSGQPEDDPQALLETVR